MSFFVRPESRISSKISSKILIYVQISRKRGQMCIDF